MVASTISKVIAWVNAYTKPIFVAGLGAMIMDIFVFGGQAYGVVPNEPANAPTPVSIEIEGLSEQIKLLVKGLEYSDKVAQDFVKMATDWKDEEAQPVLFIWKKKRAKAEEDYKQGKISKDEIAKIEEAIIKELSQRIRKEISYNEKFFDLVDVIKNKQAQCHSYSELLYIVGNSVGLLVTPVGVVELIVPGPLPPGSTHGACIIVLPDSNTIMIDLSTFPKLLLTEPFELKKEFIKSGNYWELKDKDNPLRIHRKIQILDRKGLIAGRYNNLGTDYVDLGQLSHAICDYTKAIKLNPKYAAAYSNRGASYAKLGQYPKAIFDYTKAIELNPRYAEAYYNRGLVYDKLGRLTEAISDYTKAIKFDPKYDEAYNNRGIVYAKLGQLPQAISDYTKAIELNPKEANAYGSRGLAYSILGKSQEAKKDLLKAVKLNPALKPKIKKISDHFKLNLQLD